MVIVIDIILGILIVVGFGFAIFSVMFVGLFRNFKQRKIWAKMKVLKKLGLHETSELTWKGRYYKWKF